jgi:tetratricopeptide (TPR) repeat protein
VSKEADYAQGMEFFAQEKLDDAVAAYKRSLAEDPDYADALHALAMTYAHQEKLDEAIEIGKRLIAVAPEDELAYTSLSIFYQQKGMMSWKRQLSEKKQKEPK